MTTELTKNKTNLPATTEYESEGLEDLSHADTPSKYISLNKDSGAITVHGTDTVLGDTKKSFRMIPVFQFAQWNYLSTDGMQVYGRDLIHEKNKNIGLADEAHVKATWNGQEVPSIRRHCRTIMALVTDLEAQGPMFLNAMRSKKWAMEASLIPILLDNREKKLPIFGREIIVGSEQKTNKKNQKYHVYTFKAGDVVKDEKKLATLHGMYRQLRDSQEKLVSANNDGGDTDEKTPF